MINAGKHALISKSSKSPEQNPTKKMKTSPTKSCKEISLNQSLEEETVASEVDHLAGLSFMLEDDDDCFKFFDNFKENKSISSNSREESAKKKPHVTLDLTQWQRCIVLKIRRDSKNFDLILKLQNNPTGQMPEIAEVRLQSIWCDSFVQLGDIVSIKGAWSDKFACFVVNNEDGLFVSNPDYLVSGTSVVGSLFCKRKAVLQSKFQGIDLAGSSMIIGSLIHELFQIVLRDRLSTKKEIQEAAKTLVGSVDLVRTLYASKLSIKKAEDEISIFIPKIVDFVAQYVKGSSMPIPSNFDGIIEAVEDIEENIWLPQMGLKGKIDVSVKVRPRRTGFGLNTSKYIPLELKTGRSSFSLEHRGQLLLYQMMLSDLGYAINSGLLLYLRDGIMKEIQSQPTEQKCLLNLRNELAHYLTREKCELPEPINHPSCSKCPYNTICSSYLKKDGALDRLSQEHHMRQVCKDSSDHLEPSHIDYFFHWCDILTLEDQSDGKANSVAGLWTEKPEIRKLKGCTLTDLKIDKYEKCSDGEFVYTFVKGDKLAVEDLTVSRISSGDYVTVSTSKRIAVTSGRIKEISQYFVSISLNNDRLEKYRNDSIIVDKHESISTNVFNFTNLGMLLDDTEHSNRLRQIIINREKTTFSNVLPNCVRGEGRMLMTSLNEVQRKAVAKVLLANDYALIKGLPGTGKTQTIIVLIQILNLMKKSIILTSHTHSAIDNVLMRLKDKNIKFLRLGSESRIAENLHEFGETALTSHCRTPEELAAVYSSYNIVAVSCLGTTHPIFTHRKFDVCIVDEATQVFQSTILRPIFFANKFVLVGDPQQLPPVVQSRAARKMGADESLFDRLDCDEATSVLTLQYRMNKIIAKLANQLTYNGALISANETVAARTIPKIDCLESDRWLRKILERHVDQSVFLLDTGRCRERNAEYSKRKSLEKIENNFENDTENESTNNKENMGRYLNYCEAALIIRIVKCLISVLDSGKIGVIAPFRAQVELIRNLAKSCNGFEALEINTVDQYQGRDKDVIIYSCTKTGNKANFYEKVKDEEILEDRRRLTVAITRAKSKLIIIGDEQHLASYTPFRDLSAKISSRCKLQLEAGKLGFSWNEIFSNFQT